VKKLTIAGVALAALIGPSAFAADMAVKAPAAPVPVAANWTGFYVDAGVGWQKDRFNWSYTNFAPAQLPFSLSQGQASITGHFGYQQQFNWLVIGAEVGTFASMGGRVASITSNGVAATGPCNNLAGYVCQASIASATLAGGKLGVDWGDWLLYGVGGAVVKSNIATSLSGNAVDSGQPSATRGWYGGGGVDYLLYKSKPFDLIGGVEYEHVKLNTVNECSVNPIAIAGGCPGTPAAAARSVSATENAVWAKLTLKLNTFNW
jgi:outer membrane immunogenic protein